ncbi:hypothetical protein VF14_19075 [Nostoc linckia z18]|uniref:Uncharacterized protein n=2 Tax=Nostoc linckia TaxID=92942 RepID=A0A9Q5Z802_NOSLI|nr:helix-turn-helix domain-containing protein [Nostoc linckia]PHK41131.1 hypothetical protein VF12_07810 [Nostoc linckia z15]PHK44876.1 hypothetical protein VF13_19415 [Nostoc linckia z16]PHJ58227.1 hypothetical protein VF02_28200 [Nostoc linckia z1]PHJ64390.1 hypothetical protein VF03_29170 [Nostoc linckia z2]PHJ65068.1 hypothetical protein VF05_21200 [Nostoc linckia z3]
MPAAMRMMLNAEEDRTLLELSCADGVPYRTKQRAIAIRLNAHGWNVPQIAKYFGWHDHTVRATLRRWRSLGLGGLWEATGRGRPSRMSKSDWQAIEQWVAEPQRYSARQLSQKLKDERQVEIGAEQVRRCLKKGATFGSVSAIALP